MNQADVDARIQDYYSQHFAEAERLTVRSAQGRLEFERVQELIARRIRPHSHVLDVGGATGVHAASLAGLGHDVVLIDPVPAQVREAKRQGTFDARVGDARDLQFEDDSFDVALLFGPLYHLAERKDRLRSLEEAARVVRSGGWIFAAAIPRFICHAVLTLGEEIPHPYPADWVSLLEHGTAPGGGLFPGAHFHTAEELEEELCQVGLIDISVCAIEGPDGLALEQLGEADEDLHQAALKVVRKVGHLPGIRDMTNHMMGIARVP
jgi:SAM-dependent methyltransferase